MQGMPLIQKSLRPNDNMNALRTYLVSLALSVLVVAPLSADDLDDLLDIEPSQSESTVETSPIDSLVKETPQDNFEAAVSEMKEAGNLLNESQTGRVSQRIQEKVIARLDQLISDAKKKQSKSKGKPKPGEADKGSNPQSGPPSQGEGSKQGQNPASGPGGQGAVQDLDTTRPLEEELSEWGRLPDRVRKELIQGRDDRFSTLYKKLTQRYYKRLADVSQETSP